MLPSTRTRLFGIHIATFMVAFAVICSGIGSGAR